MNARFLLSAASADDFPATGLPEIAMVGRSNVGKSTLINALVRQKIARTSAAPGKTRLANYYEISGLPGGIYLVDLPGYGYARGGALSTAGFEELTAHYFVRDQMQRRRIAGALHLIDSRHPALAKDRSAHEWLGHVGIPVAVVATKIDKLSRAEQSATARMLQSLYGANIIQTSATAGTGLDEIWRTIRSWIAKNAL